MSEEWYYLRGDLQLGPVSIDGLRSLAKAGDLERQNLIWQDGMPDWMPAGSLKGVFAGPPPVPRHPQVTAGHSAFGTGMISTGVDRAANSRMLDQLRQDIADVGMFLDELFRVLIRLNPINLQVHDFLGHIEGITDGMPNPEIATAVGNALGAVDLGNAITMLDNSDEIIVDVVGMLVRGQDDALSKVWPGCRDAVQHPWLKDPDTAAYRAQESIRRAIKLHRLSLMTIQQNFRQLQEFYPRYQNIMTRSSLWEFTRAFAAGLFGGYLGAAGHDLWENWRNKSDAEFGQAFSNAIDQFANAAIAFTLQTEASVADACKSLIADSKRCGEAVISVLAELADTTDLGPVYKVLHHPEVQKDDDSRQLFEIVCQNLKERGWPAHSERNVRLIMGL